MVDPGTVSTGRKDRSHPVYSALGRTRTLISTCGQVMRSEHISHPNKTRASLSHSLSVLKPPLIDPRAQSSFLSSIQREREREFGRKLAVVLCTRIIFACLNLINMQDNALFIFPFDKILQMKLSLTSPQNIFICDSAKLFHNSVVKHCNVTFLLTIFSAIKSIFVLFSVG